MGRGSREVPSGFEEEQAARLKKIEDKVAQLVMEEAEAEAAKHHVKVKTQQKKSMKIIRDWSPATSELLDKKCSLQLWKSESTDSTAIKLEIEHAYPREIYFTVNAADSVNLKLKDALAGKRTQTVPAGSGRTRVALLTRKEAGQAWELKAKYSWEFEMNLD